jgi:hypothetical protein
MSVSVELDVFSGRANPRWVLDVSAAQQLRALFDELSPAMAPVPQSPGLGYRGFRGTDGTVRWHAFGGAVAVDSTVLADPARRVERWLLSTLPDEVVELREMVRAQLDDG